MAAIHMLNACTIRLTGQSNYQEWKRITKNLLIMNEFWGYVSGRIPNPTLVINNNQPAPMDVGLVAAWEAKDEIALAFIRMVVDIHVDQNISSALSSKEAWDTLSSLYERRDEARILMIKAKLYSIKFVKPMSAFMSSIKEVCNELTTLGSPATRDEIVASITKALPKDYNGFISSTTRDGSLRGMTFNQLESLLLQEEQIYAKDNEEPSTSGAFTAKAKPTQKSNTAFTKQFGNMNIGSSKTNVVCHYCGIPGHIAPECRKKQANLRKQQQQQPQGQRQQQPRQQFQQRFQQSDQQQFPPRPNRGAYRGGPQGGGGQRNGYQRHYNQFANDDKLLCAFQSSKVDNTWIVDSGATRHMTGSEELLCNIKEGKGHLVTFGNAESVEVSGIGTIAPFHSPQNPSSSFPNSDAYFIPSMEKNLLSVSQMNKQHMSVLFK